MNLHKPITILMFVTLFLFIYPASGTSQDLVRVNSETARIYEEPGSTDSHFILAQEGDLFEIENLNKGWVGIQMFSGKVRYLKLLDVGIERGSLSEQVEFSKRVELCQDVQIIEDQATVEANSKYPEDKRSADAYKNVLIDKGVLSLFRKNNIPAIHNSIFLDCINDSLVPFSDSN